jgi:hypothetical protein
VRRNLSAQGELRRRATVRFGEASNALSPDQEASIGRRLTELALLPVAIFAALPTWTRWAIVGLLVLIVLHPDVLPRSDGLTCHTVKPHDVGYREEICFDQEGQIVDR